MSKIYIECDYCAGRGYEGIETGGVDYDGENDTREMVYSPCPQCLGNGRFEVDIDNLEIEYRFRYCKPTMIDGTLCFTYDKKFSEFLQERIGK